MIVNESLGTAPVHPDDPWERALNPATLHGGNAAVVTEEDARKDLVETVEAAQPGRNSDHADVRKAAIAHALTGNHWARSAQTGADRPASTLESSASLFTAALSLPLAKDPWEAPQEPVARTKQSPTTIVRPATSYILAGGKPMPASSRELAPKISLGERAPKRQLRLGSWLMARITVLREDVKDTIRQAATSYAELSRAKRIACGVGTAALFAAGAAALLYETRHGGSGRTLHGSGHMSDASQLRPTHNAAALPSGNLPHHTTPPVQHNAPPTSTAAPVAPPAKAAAQPSTFRVPKGFTYWNYAERRLHVRHNTHQARVGQYVSKLLQLNHSTYANAPNTQAGYILTVTNP